MTTPQLDMIGLIADDLTRSLAFYRRLGLEFADDAESQQHVEATLPGGIRIAWDTVETIRSFLPDFEASHGGGRIGLAFKCADAAAVDSTYEEFVADGYTGLHEPWDAAWGQRYATIEDPDGNSVDLFAWLT
ncbi:VOC family protein [Solicola gregarius]|uniref:VOC family protein n=1 Tax=Solicola gregarius TaxID=2908642 RepID=A0AA46TI24_9ACTN|nr:VOC family protein [Solicola gregarius]UYM05222.1 VOC family protein [Solicola gregarius]